MKKIMAWTLGIALLFQLAGCGTAEKNEGSAENTSGELNFPTRNIEFIVGSAPGGGSDLLARALTSAMDLSQPVVVVNRTGAGGTIATAEVMNAEPDGHTMLLGMVGPFETQPHLLDVQYTIEDSRYISALTVEPLFLAVRSDSPWNSLQDMKNEFDASGGNTLKFGSSSQGSMPHLAQEILYQEMGISAEHIPFDGANPAVVALLGGHIDALSAHLGEIHSYVDSGELKILGVYSPERVDLMPDVLTMKEQGYDLDMSGIKFVAVGKDVPDDIVAFLQQKIEEAKASETFQTFLESNYSLPSDATEEEIKEQLQRESDLYQEIIEELGLRQE